MNKIIRLGFVINSIFILLSCDSLSPNFIGNRSTGNTGDLTIAITKAMWESKIGKQIQKDFAAYEPGLGYLMTESKFNVEQVEPKDLNTLFKTNRNVLLVRISNKIKVDTAVVEILKNKWAKQQRYVTVSAKNAVILYKYFKKNGKELVNQFESWERERIIHSISLHDNPILQKEIQKKFSISLILDKGFTLKSESEEIMLIERNSRYKRMEFDTGGQEKLSILEGIMIWQENYKNKNQFNPKSILIQRDSVLKQYVKLPNNKKAYWTTEYDTIFYPVHNVVKIDGQYTVETKGSFKTVNAVMGGPFVQLSLLNPITNKIISISGWVHAPNVDKIELMRNIESMLYSIKIKKTSQEKDIHS